MSRPEPQSDIGAVKKLHQQLAACMNARDLDRVMNGFSDDVVYMPPNQPALMGKNAVRSMWASLLREFAFEVVVSTDDVEVIGDRAIERGTAIIKKTPARGEPAYDAIKYLDVLKRQSDGSWKYAQVIWNSTNPQK